MSHRNNGKNGNDYFACESLSAISAISVGHIIRCLFPKYQMSTFRFSSLLPFLPDRLCPTGENNCPDACTIQDYFVTLQRE